LHHVSLHHPLSRGRRFGDTAMMKKTGFEMSDPRLAPINAYIIDDSGDRTEFPTGAHRDMQTGKGRFDLIPDLTSAALAIHYEKGCEKYGDRNWEKGIPIATYFNSAERHMKKFKMGWMGENHLISAIWNLYCAYETILRIQLGKLDFSLYNLPDKVTLPIPWSETE